VKRKGRGRGRGRREKNKFYRSMSLYWTVLFLLQSFVVIFVILCLVNAENARIFVDLESL